MNLDEKIFLAGANGMVGKSIKKNTNKKRFGDPSSGGMIFCPHKKQLDLLNYNALEDWFIQ